jgi:LytR cell envelope-related transcriptional attenuator
MSMLTPPGMGGKYKVTGKGYPRLSRPQQQRRRRVRLAVVLITAVGVLAWGSLELVNVFSGNGATAASQVKCRVAKGMKGKSSDRAQAAQAAPELPEPGTITVNVYNATPRSGLAKKTADELQKRGFKIGKVGNAPAEHDKKVKESALLLGGPEADDLLAVLGAQVTGERTGARTPETDEDTAKKASSASKQDTTVDFVIGNAFTKLDAAASADKALTALAKAKPSPSSSKRSC